MLGERADMLATRRCNGGKHNPAIMAAPIDDADARDYELPDAEITQTENWDELEEHPAVVLKATNLTPTE
jgi:hypothetical protein